MLLGPSGCGKSTLLKAIAGFMAPVEGAIRLAGRTIERPGPDRMMVFQEFDQLLPWKTVLGNVMFPLTRQPPHAARRGRRACPRAARQGQPHPLRERLSAHAVGRHEAARRHRARARHGAGRAADGRAVRRARRAHPPQDAGGAGRAVGRRALHRHLRHPFDRGGAADRQPHPGDVAASRPGQGRAQRRPPRLLPTSARRPSKRCTSASTNLLFADKIETALAMEVHHG